MKTDSRSKSSPYIFFFVGHFNDIDHMIPVVYKFCQTNQGRPVILVTDPLYNIEGDYRFRFLQGHYAVPVVSVFDFHAPLPGGGWLARLLSPPPGNGILQRLRLTVFRGFRKLFYGRSWAGHILDHYDPLALVFEWAHPGSGLVGAFVGAGHDREIHSLSLPHGMFIYTNDFVTREAAQRRNYDDHSYRNLFDRIVYQSTLHARLAQLEGVDPEKIAVLGSARFSPEWQQINLKLQPDRFVPQKGQGCQFRVVFMVHQWNYNGNFQETFQSLRRMAEEEWLHLVVKPSTREVEERPQYLMELNTYPNVEIEGKTGSVELIRWADAVIVPASSIALEALLQGKPFIYPQHHHENTTVFENEGACWQVSNDDELVGALKHLSNRGTYPYGDEEISRALSVLVHGGWGQGDILQRYVDFILGAWREMPTQARSRQGTQPAAVE